MKNFLLYIIIAGIAQVVSAQDQIPAPQKEFKTIAFGFDVSSPLGRFIEKGWNNYEISLTAGSVKKIFFNLEAGMMDFSMNKKEDNKAYDYKASGNYFRIGADYNIFKRNKANEQNMVFFGARYGFSSTSFSANNIFIQDTVWDPRTGSLPESSLKSHWFEATTGIRVQFYRYFSMGWSLRYKIFISPRKNLNKPYFIAGYGKSAENTAFGITYSLYFTLPIMEYRPDIEGK